MQLQCGLYTPVSGIGHEKALKQAGGGKKI